MKRVLNKEEIDEIFIQTVETGLKCYDNNHVSTKTARKVLKKIPEIRSVIYESANPSQFQDVLILADKVEKRLRKVVENIRRY